MTPFETLQKYNLKTDVKSIRERLQGNVSYFDGIVISVVRMAIDDTSLQDVQHLCQNADLALLCSLAEKGERYEKAVTIIKNRRNKLRGESANGFQSKLNEFTVDTLDYLLMKITEADGEGK